MTFKPGNEKARFVRAFLKPVNTAAISILGFTTFIWGLWIANPFWTVFDQAQLYDWMNVLPEWFWGSVAVIVGVFMVYGVAKRSFSRLVLGARIGFYHWFVIGIMYFGGDWQNTGGIISMMLSAYCAFIWLNLKVNQESLGSESNPDDLID